MTYDCKSCQNQLELPSDKLMGVNILLNNASILNELSPIKSGKYKRWSKLVHVFKSDITVDEMKYM